MYHTHSVQMLENCGNLHGIVTYKNELLMVHNIKPYDLQKLRYFFDVFNAHLMNKDLCYNKTLITTMTRMMARVDLAQQFVSFSRIKFARIHAGREFYLLIESRYRFSVEFVSW